MFTSTEARLEKKIRQMEAEVQRLVGQRGELSRYREAHGTNIRGGHTEAKDRAVAHADRQGAGDAGGAHSRDNDRGGDPAGDTRGG